MYQKILLPLDGTKESEQVIPLIMEEIGQDTEVIVLQVVHPVKTQATGGQVILGSQREEADRLEALSYLQSVVKPQTVGHWRAECLIAKQASEGIVSFAQREGVEAIAMFVPERTGLTKLMKGTTSKRVRRNSPVEVRIFTAQSLEESLMPDQSRLTAEADMHNSTHSLVNGGIGESMSTAVLDRPTLTTNMLKEVDLFKDLSIGQIDTVASMGERLSIEKGETLGKEGELGQTLFIILDGEVQLSSHSSVGEISVRLAGPGDSFPMAGLLGLRTLITTGVALTDLDVLAIPTASLIDLCSKDAEIGRNMYKASAQLFANRYDETLAHLTVSVERTLQDTESNWLT